jgi:hypothetical protein
MSENVPKIDLAKLIVMASGAVLIVMGIFFIGLQFYAEWGVHSAPIEQQKGGEIGPMGLSFHTRYVGTLMLMAGAVLEVIAYMSGWPATRTRRK